MFVDIMVLVLPPPCPPVDPDDINALDNYSMDLFQIVYEGIYPLRYVALKFDIIRALSRPQIFKL